MRKARDLMTALRYRAGDGDTLLRKLARNEKGEITCWAGINLDITELRRAEERLRQTQKLESVGLLAGGIAHDFNNLLTAIIGYTEIVLHSLDVKDERRADAEEIARAARRSQSPLCRRSRS